MEAKGEEGRWAEENATPHEPSATTRPPPFPSHHPRVLPSPSRPPSQPQARQPGEPWGRVSAPHRHLPTPAGQAEGGKKGQASQTAVSWGRGCLLGRGDQDPLPPGLSAHALLRMCLPDILCPRVSPEGPERPARTEDASRGESRPFQGPGAEPGRTGAGSRHLPETPSVFSTSSRHQEVPASSWHLSLLL